MNLKSLEERIKNLHSEITPLYKVHTEKEKEILYNTVKLNEEVGELCNDILSILKLQRRSKLDKFDKRNIYEEFADVLITTIILALAAGVDIERALNDKLEKIEKRYNEELKK